MGVNLYVMQWLGTARLLVETHNRYVKTLRHVPHGGPPDPEHMDAMESFVEDFNNTADSFIIRKTAGGEYAIFDRDDDED